MAADNSIYETLDDWWDPTGSVAGLHAMNPARLGYVLGVIEKRLPQGVPGVRILDVGCGGGLLAEGLAFRGASVVGVDQAMGALRHAVSHAHHRDVHLPYLRSRMERLPFPDASFACVVSCDVLEHVSDLEHTARECARVLQPGGVFIYDTINRTLLTRVFHIWILQEWRKLVPPMTHDWAQFIRPAELRALLRGAGLEPVETRGLVPVRPLRFALHLLRHRKGRDRMPPFRIGSPRWGSYIGYAVKRVDPVTRSRS